ncbi:MAG: hypothetical protein AAF721_02935 [Myxococcota bacterium]
MSSNDSLAGGESSVLALERSGRGKVIALAGIAVVAAAAGAYFLLAPSSSRGAEDKPNRVLIVGPDSSDLAGWLHDQGFSAEQKTYASAVSAGQDVDPTLDGVQAAVAFADEQGFGFVAFHPPEIYKLGTLGAGGDTVPKGATMAVVPIGDLAKDARVTYGVPSSAVEHIAPQGQQVGLMLGLFEQPQLASIVEGDVGSGDLDVLADLRSKDAPANYKRLVTGQKGFDNLALGWEAARDAVETPRPMIPLAAPYQRVDAYPLADGGILALTTEPGWQTQNGYRAELGDDRVRFARYVKPGEITDGGPSLATAGKPCGPVDVTDIHAMQVSSSGDSLALQRNIEVGGASGWSVQVIKHDPEIVGCPFAAVGYALKARQMHTLGPPHPSGAMLMVTDRLRFGFKGRERSWNYPVIGPDGGAAAWIDGTLVAYAGNSRYEESTNHGLAFMSALTENRLEVFFPLRVLLPGQDTEPLFIEHIQPAAEDRLLLVIGDRSSGASSVVEVTFTKPIRSRLVTVDHQKDPSGELAKVMVKSGAGTKTRVVLERVPTLDNGTFGADGSLLAYSADGQALLLRLDGKGSEPEPLSPPDFGAEDVRLAPSGAFAIVHRDLMVEETVIRTASVVALQ